MAYLQRATAPLKKHQAILCCSGSKLITLPPVQTLVHRLGRHGAQAKKCGSQVLVLLRKSG